MMMECISFGVLSRLFALIKNNGEKKAFSIHFGSVSSEILSSWLHGFVVLRNACAHHSRIWNRKLMKDLMFPNRPSARFISRISGEEEGLRKFYGISSCILKVLSHISTEQHEKYKHRFKRLSLLHGIDKQAMGFPSQQESYDIWS
jgi:abortive infection bacteriophage resistance protein